MKSCYWIICFCCLQMIFINWTILWIVVPVNCHHCYPYHDLLTTKCWAKDEFSFWALQSKRYVANLIYSGNFFIFVAICFSLVMALKRVGAVIASLRLNIQTNGIRNWHKLSHSLCYEGLLILVFYKCKGLEILK